MKNKMKNEARKGKFDGTRRKIKYNLYLGYNNLYSGYLINLEYKRSRKQEN